MFLQIYGSLSLKKIGSTNRKSANREKNIGSVNPQTITFGKCSSLRICDLLSLFADRQPLVSSSGTDSADACTIKKIVLHKN